uniref:Selenoprotein M n=1 Tax=Steinernema glaseri TaxID=37863 RepID=A0A1I7YRT0_9BILA
MDPCRSLVFALLVLLLCAMCVRSQTEATDYYGIADAGDVFPQVARHRLRLALFGRPEVMLRKRVSEQEINSLLRNTWLG